MAQSWSSTKSVPGSGWAWVERSNFMESPRTWSVLGKGMANGYAISVVTGKAEVMMAAAQKLFISSTFFPNSDGYIAALKDH